MRHPTAAVVAQVEREAIIEAYAEAAGHPARTPHLAAVVEALAARGLCYAPREAAALCTRHGLVVHDDVAGWIAAHPLLVRAHARAADEIRRLCLATPVPSSLDVLAALRQAGCSRYYRADVLALASACGLALADAGPAT